MKKILFPILLVLCLSACKEDLTDYFDRMDIREHANDSLKKENNELEKQIEAQRKWNEALAEMNARVKLESDELKRKLDSLEATLVVDVEPKLRQIEFVTAENPTLPNNITCDIIGDSIIDCFLRGMNRHGSRSSEVKHGLTTYRLLLIDGHKRTIESEPWN